MSTAAVAMPYAHFSSFGTPSQPQISNVPVAGTLSRQSSYGSQQSSEFELLEQTVADQYANIKDIPSARNGRPDIDHIFGPPGRQGNAQASNQAHTQANSPANTPTSGAIDPALLPSPGPTPLAAATYQQANWNVSPVQTTPSWAQQDAFAQQNAIAQQAAFSQQNSVTHQDAFSQQYTSAQQNVHFQQHNYANEAIPSFDAAFVAALFPELAQAESITGNAFNALGNVNFGGDLQSQTSVPQVPAAQQGSNSPAAQQFAPSATDAAISYNSQFQPATVNPQVTISPQSHPSSAPSPHLISPTTTINPAVISYTQQSQPAIHHQASVSPQSHTSSPSAHVHTPTTINPALLSSGLKLPNPSSPPSPPAIEASSPSPVHLASEHPEPPRRVTRSSTAAANNATASSSRNPGGRTSTVTRTSSARANTGPYKPALSTRKRRARRDMQDGDEQRGFACPYRAHRGSEERCAVLLGSKHEVPRHLAKHLIEEEDRLRVDPALDPAQLVFGGAPSHRPVCPHCRVVFSRRDAWERHVKRSEANKWDCSKPVGMHGKHAPLETFPTDGAAEVLAVVKVSGEKKTILRIKEVYSHWGEEWRFKKIRGGRSREPEWVLRGEGRRGTVRAYTPWDGEMERANALREDAHPAVEVEGAAQPAAREGEREGEGMEDAEGTTDEEMEEMELEEEE